MQNVKAAVVSALGVSLMLIACDDAAPAAYASESLGAASAAAQPQGGALQMPSPQQKRTMVAQFNPYRSILTMFPAPPDASGRATPVPWTQAEEMEAKGFLIQYLESPVGSAAERRAWNGVQRYYALYLERIAESREAMDNQAEEQAAAIMRDEPEARQICTRFRQAGDALQLEEARQLHERMEQLKIAYPGQLSICATELRFKYLELTPQPCSAAPC
ncbi:hypothetical protein HNP47_002094 [Brevundimonas vesicularis]|uniref:Lipoprotein n=1 Tax=Brevundimonas vesicularis TaxID=41276 RepID=A0A7W9L673_BREVE|nr:hypothetical protein [Brevundimonas vesicularis]MBB5772090.1 hypothetical protein [Brevundimonas vesicularis]